MSLFSVSNLRTGDVIEDLAAPCAFRVEAFDPGAKRIPLTHISSRYGGPEVTTFEPTSYSRGMMNRRLKRSEVWRGGIVVHPEPPTSEPEEGETLRDFGHLQMGVFPAVVDASGVPRVAIYAGTTLTLEINGKDGEHIAAVEMDEAAAAFLSQMLARFAVGRSTLPRDAMTEVELLAGAKDDPESYALFEWFDNFGTWPAAFGEGYTISWDSGGTLPIVKDAEGNPVAILNNSMGTELAYLVRDFRDIPEGNAECKARVLHSRCAAGGYSTSATIRGMIPEGFEVEPMDATERTGRMYYRAVTAAATGLASYCRQAGAAAVVPFPAEQGEAACLVAVVTGEDVEGAYTMFKDIGLGGLAYPEIAWAK